MQPFRKMNHSYNYSNKVVASNNQACPNILIQDHQKYNHYQILTKKEEFQEEIELQGAGEALLNLHN